MNLNADLEAAVREPGFGVLPVTFAHAAEGFALPPIHRDPFDRMLVAPARLENLPLLTRDPNILRYPASVINVCNAPTVHRRRAPTLNANDQ